MAVTFLLTGAALASAQPAKLPVPDVVQAQEKKVDVGAPQTALFVDSAPASSSRVSITTDYLLWWTKGGPLNTPLASTGQLPDLPPGAIGQPTTQVLFGDRPMLYGGLSGIRLGGAVDLGNCLALEGNYFVLQTGVVNFRAASDINGNPRLTRPFFSNQLGVEDSLGTAEPDPRIGPWAGSIGINSHTQLQGWELNLSAKERINNRTTFVALAGFRSMQLNEDINIEETLLTTTPNTLTFAGQVVNPGDILFDADRFHTSNNFYGGQFGGRLEWQNECGNLTVTVIGKLALGVNQQIAVIDGGSLWVTPGVQTTSLPGGVLALPSNMGRYSRNVFSAVPEAGLTVAWNITPNVKASIGYTFIAWSHVLRPGNQIDSNLNSAQIPTSQVFGNGQGTARPGFAFQDSSYWAQGINVGLEFKF